MQLKKKVLAVDIDGTLVTRDKKITNRTLAAIDQFRQAGGLLILASGRPPCGMKPFVEQLNMQDHGGYVLAYNGSRVTDAQSGKILFERFLDKNQLPKILELANQFGIHPMTYQGDTVIVEDASDRYLQLEVAINRLQLKVVADLAAFVQFPIPKCLCTGEPTVLEQLMPVLQAELTGVSVFRSESFFLEVNPQGIGKGEVLEKLLGQLGFTAKDLVAVGDGYNDVTMLQYASLGVAMGNAREPVKAAANFVTDTNDADGLAKVIENLLLS